MALQGTIDAFPLTDVLQLLSASAKSGRLLLEGDRGRAELWIEQGRVVGGDTPSTSPGAALMVFELLRFADGSFVFDVAEGAPPVPVTPATLTDCVQDASELLEEWVRIEAVVPSMRHVIEIVPELGVETVSIGADEWRLVAAAGDAPTVEALAARIGLDEFAACAALAGLVERSLLRVSDPPAGEPTRSADLLTLVEQDDASPRDSVVPVDVADTVAAVEAIADEAFPEHFPIDDLLGATAEVDDEWAAGDDESHRFAAAQTFEPLGTDPFVATSFDDADSDLPGRTADAWDEVVAGQTPAVEEPWQELPIDPAEQQAADETADEVLRQMSRLSPKAAEAIAAALNGPTSTTPVSHDVGTEHRDNDGPVTFLGSF